MSVGKINRNSVAPAAPQASPVKPGKRAKAEDMPVDAVLLKSGGLSGKGGLHGQGLSEEEAIGLSLSLSLELAQPGYRMAPGSREVFLSDL